MITPKIDVFARITQSFDILKNNFLKLTLIMFIYQFVALVVIGTLLTVFVFGGISLSTMSGSELLNLFSNPEFIIIVLLGIIFYIVYLILFIPVLLGLIKTIYNIINQEEIILMDNLKYGFKKIFDSFKTYWFVFFYVALIPSLIFIVGGIIFILGMQILGGFIIGFSSIYFIISIIYRGLKSKFAIYSAVDKNEFTKNNFEKSLKFTKNNWWRILGNLLVVGLLIIVISWIFTFVFSLLPIGFGNSFVNTVFYGFLNNIITTSYAVFAIIFTYLLFKRLELESLENIENDNAEGIVVEKEINNEEVIKKIEL